MASRSASRQASARSAAGVLAESWKPVTGTAAALGSTGSAGPMTMCALVPIMPNELTPAYRPLAPARHGRAWPLTEMLVPSRSIRGLSVSKCTSGGTTPLRTQSSALMTPAMPAAPSRWPRLAFTEPTCSSAPALRRPSAAMMASISIGSPSEVPVPCASISPMSAGVSPASASADSSRSIWASTLGAVKPEERPSWLIAEPWITP